MIEKSLNGPAHRNLGAYGIGSDHMCSLARALAPHKV